MATRTAALAVLVLLVTVVLIEGEAVAMTAGARTVVDQPQKDRQYQLLLAACCFMFTKTRRLCTRYLISAYNGAFMAVAMLHAVSEVA